MGPRPFGHGNAVKSKVICASLVASMGPRPFGHGNGLREAVGRRGVGEASMGPRPFGHGNIYVPFAYL